MKTPITEIERRELQLRIEAATGLPFQNPLPEFFLGHKEEIFEGEFLPVVGGAVSALPTGKATSKLSSGKGMLAIGYQASNPKCPFKCVDMTVSFTSGPDAPQYVVGRFKLN